MNIDASMGRATVRRTVMFHSYRMGPSRQVVSGANDESDRQPEPRTERSRVVGGLGIVRRRHGHHATLEQADRLRDEGRAFAGRKGLGAGQDREPSVPDSGAAGPTRADYAAEHDP